MTKFLFVILISFISFNSSAQVDPVGDFNKHVVANWKGDYFQVSQYKVKGSPYFLGEAFDGTINLVGDKKLTGVKVLYNLYSQMAGIEVNNELAEANGHVTSFSITLPEKYAAQSLLFKHSSAFDITTYKGFFNVLQEGEKVAFLKAYKIKMIPDPTNEMVKDLRIFDQYYEYYLYDKRTKKLEKIKLKEKVLLAELSAGQEAKDFIKEFKLELWQEAHCIAFIKAFNSDFK